MSTRGSMEVAPAFHDFLMLRSSWLRAGNRVVARGSTTSDWLTCVSETVAPDTRTVVTSGYPASRMSVPLTLIAYGSWYSPDNLKVYGLSNPAMPRRKVKFGLLK